jgi:hypothetical protein
MIERVAKAIYEEDDPWHKAWPWPDLNESQGSPETYRRIAAAAIKAMREPTIGMVAAFWRQKNCGTQEIGERGDATSDYDAWQSAIDAALVGEG